MVDLSVPVHEPQAVAPERFARLLPVFPEESGVSPTGELEVGGVEISRLAQTFGTPLQVFDEAGLRRQVRRYVDGLRARWPNGEVLFASKALPILAMYQLAASEGLSVDVAGGGELTLALTAGVPGERLYFHGNAKTSEEIALALENGVGTIIIDNEDELDRLNALVAEPQHVLVRVTPGIDAETHPSQATGGDDSKFGVPLAQLPRVLERIRSNPLLLCDGVHLHIGSQILNTEQFTQAVESIARVGDFAVYDVGGGLGVQYTADQKAPSVEDYLDAVVETARKVLPAHAKLLIEPGRSLVARAGISVYRVVSVKDYDPTFVAVDGGMADQMDIALTRQRYEAVLANRLTERWDRIVQVVGRQCESGDLLVSGAAMPAAVPDDLVALATTGAYSYTFANNYNGALRPAIVFVEDGNVRLVVRRETYDDLLRLHTPALTRS